LEVEAAARRRRTIVASVLRFR
jgi:hypothetical protein